jgi:hypothetical protein
MLYLMKTFKSWGGRSDSGQWSNSYHIRSDNAIDHVGWQGVIDVIVGREKQVHLETVSFMRSLITPFAENPLNQPEKVLRVFNLAGSGGRVVPAGRHGHDLNVALIVKRQLASGRGGRLFWRGCVHEDDTELGAGGRYMLTPGSPLTTNIVRDEVGEIKNLGAGFFHVIPNKPGLIVQYSRDVTGFSIGGLTLNRRDHRRKPNLTLMKAVENLLRELAEQAMNLAPSKEAAALLTGIALAAFGGIQAKALSALGALGPSELALIKIPAILQ